MIGEVIHARSMLCCNVDASAVVGCFVSFFLGEIGGDCIWVGYGGAGLMAQLGSLLIHLVLGAAISRSVYVPLGLSKQREVQGMDKIEMCLPIYFYFCQYWGRIIHWRAAVIGCGISDKYSVIVDAGRRAFINVLQSFDELGTP
jgi:hypothetical protein